MMPHEARALIALYAPGLAAPRRPIEALMAEIERRGHKLAVCMRTGAWMIVNGEVVLAQVA